MNETFSGPSVEIILMRLPSVRFKTFVPAQEARPAPPLGPLLGQYGLNIIQFCDDLNSRTFGYQRGVNLPINVKKSPIFPKGYDIKVKPPTISFLFSVVFFDAEGSFSDSMQDGLDTVTLMNLVRIYSLFHSVSLENGAKTIFSFINSVSGQLKIQL